MSRGFFEDPQGKKSDGSPQEHRAERWAAISLTWRRGHRRRGVEAWIDRLAGGASANTFNLAYSFYPPGALPTGGLATNVTGTTATAVKASGGLLHTLTVNTGGAGTITIFDLPGASCTGTPATNQRATITVTATTLQTFTYDVYLSQGICVKASVAMDFTVSSQ